MYSEHRSNTQSQREKKYAKQIHSYSDNVIFNFGRERATVSMFTKQHLIINIYKYQFPYNNFIANMSVPGLVDNNCFRQTSIDKDCPMQQLTFM